MSTSASQDSAVMLTLVPPRMVPRLTVSEESTSVVPGPSSSSVVARAPSIVRRKSSGTPHGRASRPLISARSATIAAIAFQP
jgi:hypothetical protein